MTRYIDPNSGAAPQPGGYAGPEGESQGHALPADAEEGVEQSQPTDSEEEEVEELEDDSEGSDEEDASDEDPEEEFEDFDPSQHTVDDVVAYVEENPDQRDAILEAEQAGRNRVSLIEKLSS